MTELKTIVEKVLKTGVLIQAPPVLVDIGASGAIHSEWELLAPFSTCIAFDADDRDFKNSDSTSGYKTLHLVNSIVSDKNDPTTIFYLTSSPHCSSSLEPLNDKLEPWSFSSLFDIEKRIELKSVSLANVLQEKNITGIDWFKTDSQGTDLRLFTSIPNALQKKTLLAQFEPGIIDAYKGEDKLHSLLAYMDTLPFWASELIVKGAKRISKNTLEKNKLSPDSLLNIPDCACWGEITYFNNLGNDRTTRDILLGWVFSTIKNQHGFALEILNLNHAIEPLLLAELKAYSIKRLFTANADIGLKQKIKNKLISFINKL